MVEGLVVAKLKCSEGTGSYSVLLRICPDHSRVVLGGSEAYANGTGEVQDQPKWFPDNRWASRQITWSSYFLDFNPDGPETYPSSSGTSENGPKRFLKCSRMS